MENAFSDFHLRLYCDESGNSGSNYLDPEQPVHVLAGVAVHAESEGELNRLMSDLSGSRGTREVHALKWLKRPGGRRRLLEFLLQVGQLRVVPLFFVAEKRFAIAAKIVDTFFDPFHNARAEWLPTTANVDRHSLAEFFYDLPDSFLKEFAQAYRAPTIASFEAVINSLATCCELMQQERTRFLAWTLRGNLSNLPDLVHTEALEGSAWRHPIMTSLNVPVFAQFVRMADAFLSIHPGEVEIVHDETTEFEAVFTYFFDAFKGPAGTQELLLLQDGTPVRFGFESLRHFRTAKSESCAGVQLADIFASAVRFLMISATRGDEWDDASQGLAATLLPAFLFDEPQIAGHIASGKFLRDVFGRLMNSAKPADIVAIASTSRDDA